MMGETEGPRRGVEVEVEVHSDLKVGVDGLFSCLDVEDQKFEAWSGVGVKGTPSSIGMSSLLIGK